jgi:hypothetical protein
MRTINRTFLPESPYKLEGKTYQLALSEKSIPAEAVGDSAKLERLGYRVLAVDVLPTRLKGVRDLHGRYYAPNRFLYVRIA